eukprot:GAHX01001311.1.p1 GENE.GAHX01001311.1~~GAHX01001311.1.p1  ORF type:complete len:292 (-),score=45.14 GAHX01001311.1:27-902(-)
MKAESFTFYSLRNTKLHATIFSPKTKNIECTIIAFHGFGNNIDMLKRFGFLQRYVKAGYRMCGFDFEGHGHSEGDDFIVLRIEDYISDAKTFVSKLEKKGYIKGTIIFLAYSMGGNIAFSLACDSEIKERVEGVVLLSPLFGFSKYMYYHKKLLEQPIRMASQLVPRVSISAAIDVEMPRPDNPVVDQVLISARDSRTENAMSFQSLTNLMNLADNIDNLARHFEARLLIFHGDEDRTTSYEESKTIIRKIKSKDKMIVKMWAKTHFLPITDQEIIFNFVNRFIVKTMNDK